MKWEYVIVKAKAGGESHVAQVTSRYRYGGRRRWSVKFLDGRCESLISQFYDIRPISYETYASFAVVNALAGVGGPAPGVAS